MDQAIKDTFTNLQHDCESLRSVVARDCSGPEAPMLIEGLSFGLSKLEDLFDKGSAIDELEAEQAAKEENVPEAYKGFPDQCGF